MNGRDRRQAALLARQRNAARTIAQEAAYHQARVLLVVEAFSGRTRGIRGLSRLARIDFLVRFPHVLDHTEHETIRWPLDCQTQPEERVAADSRLARRRYGLWIDRYSLILGGLISRQLVTLTAGRAIEPVATERGRNAAAELRQVSSWNTVSRRARFLKDNMNLSAERLDDLLRPALQRIDDQSRAVN